MGLTPKKIPALLWRTERGLFAGWLIGAVVFGGVMGSVLGGVGDILLKLFIKCLLLVYILLIYR